ncbi:MAG: hypothetical protein D6719_13230 [Candidatus Dadabacteria bacterium]|nr:MAG: hypothetical protein D6719_13230 [Candidatus Dadabacteria bacterium]
MQVPSNFKPLYSRDEIERAVKKIASEITLWAEEVWEKSQTDILAIPILRGGLFFYADIVRCVQHSVGMAPARSWGYELNKNNVKRDTVEMNLDDVPARGRNVLLVDDICDSGRTLKALTRGLLEIGALEVKTAVIVRRAIPEPEHIPDWTGFEYEGTEWLVGYGMDDSDRWRNLPDIYVIKQG